MIGVFLCIFPKKVLKKSRYDADGNEIGGEYTGGEDVPRVSRFGESDEDEGSSSNHDEDGSDDEGSENTEEQLAYELAELEDDDGSGSGSDSEPSIDSDALDEDNDMQNLLGYILKILNVF